MSPATTVVADGALDLGRPTAALLATIPWEGPWLAAGAAVANDDAANDDAAIDTATATATATRAVDVDVDAVSAGAFFEGL